MPTTPISAQTIEELYQQTFAVIRNKCSRMLHDRAEGQDVAQETFTRLWIERERITDAEALVSWVYRTSTRLAIDRIRHGARMQIGSAESVELAGIDCRTPEQIARWRELASAVHEIPAKELEAAILCRVDGLTQQQAAGVTGKSERSVRRLLSSFDRRVAKVSASHALTSTGRNQ